MSRPLEGKPVEAGASAMARFAHLDGLRGLAALFVVVTHVVLISAPAHRGGHSEGARPLWLPPGHLAVAVFIVLSGFCLTLPVVAAGGGLRGGTRRFYRRRARRILPTYYAAFALTLVLIWTAVGAETGTFWDYSVPVSVAGYIGNALLLQDFIGYWQVSVPFWSIAVEVQIYLLFPLLVLCWRRFGARLTLFYTILLSYFATIATYFVGKVGPAFAPGLTLYFVGFFVLGMAAAWLATSSEPRWAEKRRRLPWGLFAISSGLCVCALMFVGRASLDALILFIELPLALCVTCLLVALSRPDRTHRLRSLLGSRTLATVGVFSYSLYLVHAPLLQAEWQYAVRPLHLSSLVATVLLAGLGIPLVLAVAYCFHRLFERPFMSSTGRSRASHRGSVDVLSPSTTHAPGPLVPSAAPTPAAPIS